MSYPRLDVEDFNRTQPVVHPRDAVDERAEAQLDDGIFGDSPWDRALIAICIVAVVAGLAALSGCGRLA